MTGPVFVDTNVLLYAVDAAHPLKHHDARSWREWLWKTRRGRISFQVLQEFYANVLKKWPAAKGPARQEVSDLLAWRPVTIDEKLLQYAWLLQDRYSFSFWDSLIVAAAKVTLSTILLTEDFQAGRNIEGLLVVNPFTVKPPAL